MLCYDEENGKNGENMNFNIYLNKDMGAALNRVAKDQHRSRNSIISEALEEWLHNHAKARWPADFFEFAPIDDVPDFKGLRNELSTPLEDPLR